MNKKIIKRNNELLSPEKRMMVGIDIIIKYKNNF